MEDTLHELRERIKVQGLTSPAANARISAYISSNILKHPNSLFKNRVPPLDIIAIALRRLLGADDAPRLGDIPDLLDFATTVEFYRGRALEETRKALKRNEELKKEQNNLRQLSEEEETSLRKHLEDDLELREIYIEVVLQFCQFHIYHLWTSNPPRSADATLRLCEYFPDLNRIYNRTTKSPRLFHYDLNDDERELLRDRGLDCCAFVSDSFEWAESQCEPGQVHAMFQTELFAAEFPCKVEAETLCETLLYFIDQVEGIVQELQDMFPL